MVMTEMQIKRKTKYERYDVQNLLWKADRTKQNNIETKNN